MIRAWKAFWDDLAAQLELRAAELRTGVTLIEAVAADRFETELRAISWGEVGRYREVAIDAALIGIEPEQARKAFATFARRDNNEGEQR